MIYNLVDPFSQVLMTKTEKFSFSNPPVDPIELANNLIETMIHNKGLGLAANQCGLPYRCFVLHSEKPLAVFNPFIADVTSEHVMLDEGCLTYPNLFVKIKRPKSIKARFQDALGEWHTEKFTGVTARAFQHEYDHLDGFNFTKRANLLHLTRAQNEKKQLDRQLRKLQSIAK
jgi:peptide deformylase